MPAGSYLLVPVKPLHAAKSRLRSVTRGAAQAHAELVTAVVLDTVTAARRARGVREVIAVTSDPDLAAALGSTGIDVLADLPGRGLNAALRCAAEQLRETGRPPGRIGALQADLPALRTAELERALQAAGDERAFCPDRHGTGTTLLLAATGQPLDPRFGPGSALAHTGSGAKELRGPWESLRCDVDTAEDLAAARALGVGPRTAAVMAGR